MEVEKLYVKKILISHISKKLRSNNCTLAFSTKNQSTLAEVFTLIIFSTQNIEPTHIKKSQRT